MPRTLSEQEFNAVKQAVLDAAPTGLSEEDFTRRMGWAMQSAIQDAENSPQLEGSAIGRFAAGAWKNLNPVTAAQGIYGAIRHPVDTAGAMLDAQLGEFKKAAADYQHGRYVDMAGHTAAGALPLLGPAAAAAGEGIASGDVAGGVGEGVGLVLPFAAADAARGVRAGTQAAVRGVRASGGAAALDSVAELADQAANRRFVETVAPTVGPNKTRFTNSAEKVAPKILRDADLSALSREGLLTKVEAKFTNATTALDDAADARYASQQVHTEPLIAKLDEEIASLTAQPVEASRPIPAVENGVKQARPMGEAVEPAPNASEIGTLRQIRQEVARLGSVAPYESIRRIRQAWDSVAKVKYMHSTAADVLKAQGEASGAERGTAAMRDALAATDPNTAVANADYSLFKSTRDVLKATDEAERSRPRVGRGLIARATGAMVGAHEGGAAGAGIGVAVASVAERAAQLAPTTKILVARQLASVADLLRSGKVQQAQQVVKQTVTLMQRAKRVPARYGNAITNAGTALPMAAEDQAPPPPATGQR